MDLESYLRAEFDEHGQLLRDTQAAVGPAFAVLVECACRSLDAGGKLLLFGNGGSAGDAQHIATELVVRYEGTRRALPAIALTTDTSILTASGNDFGFDAIFARQVDALARPEDLVIGISTSGESANVLQALEMAREKGAVAAGLTGCGGGKMREVADPLVVVPSSRVCRIQEMHILIGHLLCGAIEHHLRST